MASTASSGEAPARTPVGATGMADQGMLAAVAAVMASLKCAVEAVRSSELALVEAAGRLAGEMSSVSQAIENLETEWTSLPTTMKSLSAGEISGSVAEVLGAAAPSSSSPVVLKHNDGQRSCTLKMFDMAADDASVDGECSVADSSGYESPVFVDIPAQPKPVPQGGSMASSHDSSVDAAHDAEQSRSSCIVVVGGSNAGAAALQNTEILELPTMLFSPGPMITVPRTSCSAVWLDDDQLLVAGGCHGDVVMNTTEILNLRTMASSPGPRMREARASFRIGRLDKQRVVLVGGLNNTAGVLASTEILCVDLMTFMPGPSMRSKRRDCAVEALEEGRILVAGGCSEAEETLDTTEILDLAAERFLEGPRMLAPRAACASAMVDDGHVLLAGGFDGSDVLSSTEIFDMTTMSFVPGPDMGIRRDSCAACAFANGDVLIAGGNDGEDSLQSTETLDVAAMAFRAGPPMSTEREDFTLHMCRAIGGSRRARNVPEWVTVAPGSVDGGAKLDEEPKLTQTFRSFPDRQNVADFLAAKEWEELRSAAGTEPSGSDLARSDVTAKDLFFVESMELDWSDQESFVLDDGSPQAKPVQGWQADAHDPDLEDGVPGLVNLRHAPRLGAAQQPAPAEADSGDSQLEAELRVRQEDVEVELPDLVDLRHVPSPKVPVEEEAEAKELSDVERVVQDVFEQSIQRLVVANEAQREASEACDSSSDLGHEAASELDGGHQDVSEEVLRVEERQQSWNGGGRSLYKRMLAEKDFLECGFDLSEQTADVQVESDGEDRPAKEKPNESMELDEVDWQTSQEATPSEEPSTSWDLQEVEQQVAQEAAAEEKLSKRKRLSKGGLRSLLSKSSASRLQAAEVERQDDTIATEDPHEKLDVEQVERQARDRLFRRFAAAEEEAALNEHESRGLAIAKIPTQVSQVIGGLPGSDGRTMYLIVNGTGHYLVQKGFDLALSKVPSHWKIITWPHSGVSSLMSLQGKFLSVCGPGEEDYFLSSTFSSGSKWRLVPCGTYTYFIRSVHGHYLASQQENIREQSVYMSPNRKKWEQWTLC